MPVTRTVNADDYYRDDDMFDFQGDQVDGLKERLEGYVENARALVEASDANSMAVLDAIEFFRGLLAHTVEFEDEFGTPSDGADNDGSACDACGGPTGGNVMGCPDGREVCQECFDCGEG